MEWCCSRSLWLLADCGVKMFRYISCFCFGVNCHRNDVWSNSNAIQFHSAKHIPITIWCAVSYDNRSFCLSYVQIWQVNDILLTSCDRLRKTLSHILLRLFFNKVMKELMHFKFVWIYLIMLLFFLDEHVYQIFSELTMYETWLAIRFGHSKCRRFRARIEKCMI